MDYRLYADGTHSRPAIIRRSMTTLSDVSDRSGEDLTRSMVNSFQDFIGEPFKEYEFTRDEQKEISQIEKKYRSQEWNFLL
jgi:lipoate-protein ligase A